MARSSPMTARADSILPAHATTQLSEARSYASDRARGWTILTPPEVRHATGELERLARSGALGPRQAGRRKLPGYESSATAATRCHACSQINCPRTASRNPTEIRDGCRNLIALKLRPCAAAG